MHMHYHVPFFNYCCDPVFSLVNLNVEEYKQMNALPQCRYYSQDYRFHYAFASDVQMMLQLQLDLLMAYTLHPHHANAHRPKPITEAILYCK